MNAIFTSTRSTVALLDEDPDLAAGTPEGELHIARERSVARVLQLPVRGWDPGPACAEIGSGALGLFVIDGLLMRRVTVGQRGAAELLARGDVLRPWDTDADYEPLTVGVHWLVLKEARLAILDASFMRRMAPWPGVACALAERIACRTRHLALTGLVAHLPRTEPRLLLLFWLFASRWGKVAPDGVRISLPLTHELLASLAGTNRPTVTGALARLSRAGLLEREQPDRWLLTADAIQSLTHLGHPGWNDPRVTGD